VITTIDLKVPNRPLGSDIDSITLANYGSAWVLIIRCVVEGKGIEAAFELRDCSCVVPLALGPELADHRLQFGRGVA